MEKKMEISISSQTIRNILLIIAVIFFVWKLSDVVILLVTAVIIATALNPAVKWLHKKLPLVLSAIIVVIVLILPIVYILVAIVPSFIGQFPVIIDRVTSALGGANFLPSFLRQLDFSQYFQNNSAYLLESTKMAAHLLFQIVTFIFLVFYLLIDGEALHRLVALSISKKNRKQIEKLAADLGNISGRYIRGNLLISLICSSTIFIGLMLLHIPYALPLAIFAGIFDLLPLIGGVTGALPSVILGFTISPLTGFLTIVLFVAYQAIENDILAPNIYNKVLNLLPFLSFISVIIGSVMLGVAGAFLALPIAAGIPTIIRYVEDNYRKGKKA